MALCKTATGRSLEAIGDLQPLASGPDAPKIMAAELQILALYFQSGLNEIDRASISTPS